MAAVAASEEQSPILFAVGEEDGVDSTSLLGQRGRRRLLPGWVGLLSAAALLALAGAGGATARRHLSAGRGAAVTRPLPRTQFLAELQPETDPGVVDKAAKLTDEAHELEAKIKTDAVSAASTKKQADAQLKDGNSRVKAAKAETVAAKANMSKAEAMQREAELELKKAKAMMDASKSHIEHADANSQKGQKEISEGTASSNKAHKVLDAVEKEKEHAAEVEKEQIDTMWDKVSYLEGEAEADQKAADAASKAAQDKMDAANAKVKEAIRVMDEAHKNASDAKATTEEANKDVGKSKAIEDWSRQEVQLAAKSKKQGLEELAQGKKAATKAEAADENVKQEVVEVAKIEHEALHASASHRICMDLASVRLMSVGHEDDFAPLAVEKDVSTLEKCREWCKQQEDCVQMIFSSVNKACHLYPKATTQVSEWRDEYSSSFCSDEKEEPHLKKMIKAVYAQKPTIPPVVDCSWADDDCSKTKCCNDAACSWDFKTCKPLSCFQSKDSALCKDPQWGSGTVIGGARPVREIKAPKGVTLQGTSLFCFMVVNWKGAEGAIANNIKEKKLGIYQCDAHTILSGWETSKTPWSTYMNADAFVKLWQQLQQDKLYLQHDWTVKADADTVFFPHILKMHLSALKLPQGSRVYVKNIDYKFQYLGALEVLTREAVELYFEKGGQCAGKLTKAHPKAGEDFYMKTCLDAIGVDSKEDFKLLRDGVCGDDCPGSDGPCSDGWIAGYHFYRDVDAWNACYGEATKAQAATKADSGAAAPPEERMTVVQSKASKDARSLLDEAKKLKTKVQPDAAAAKDMNESAWGKINAGHEKVHDAEHQAASAKANMTEAREAERKAKAKISEAEAVSDASERASQVASANENDGLKALRSGRASLKKAQASEKKAEEWTDKAADAEEDVMDEIASRRVCVQLPGVRLTGNKPLNLTPAATQMDAGTPEQCSSWCRKHRSCKQSIFSAGNKGCYFFEEPSDQPIAFNDKYNSSYCGEWKENDANLAMLKKVFKMKPYVPPVRQCSWAGENCMFTKCCANVPVPNWKFTKFEWYTCYKRDENFAGCHLGPAPSNWDGTKLGGMGTREVPKAPEGVLTQGTSLFCFAVVMWNNPPKEAFWSSEAELANNIKKTGRSIYQCEEHAFFEGSGLGGGDGSSINNIDSFIGAWNKVRDDGRYLKHDWTIKVDCDAVFFPDRLKRHLWALRTPQGSRVYLKNINFKFNFLGALEIFSKEALQHYFDKSGDCAGKVGHQGGEDYYMEACMDGIGIDHQTDFKLLNDKYAATGNCNDPWVVGFHFYKKVSHWNDCWTAAVNSAKASGQDYAKLER